MIGAGALLLGASLHALATLDSETGFLRRYEPIGNAEFRLTHLVAPSQWGKGWEWERGDVETFRSNPMEEFRVHDEPGPFDHPLPTNPGGGLAVA